MSLALQGVAQLTRELQALGGRSQTISTVRQSVGQAMNLVKAKARSRAPVGTKSHKTYKGRIVKPGFARKSLRVITGVSKDKSRAFALLGVRSEAFYALQFLELGTSRIARRPWLTPAFEESQDEALAEIGRGMRKRIDAIAAKRSK